MDTTRLSNPYAKKRKEVRTISQVPERWFWFDLSRTVWNKRRHKPRSTPSSHRRIWHRSMTLTCISGTWTRFKRIRIDCKTKRTNALPWVRRDWRAEASHLTEDFFWIIKFRKSRNPYPIPCMVFEFMPGCWCFPANARCPKHSSSNRPLAMQRPPVTVNIWVLKVFGTIRISGSTCKIVRTVARFDCRRR